MIVGVTNVGPQRGGIELRVGLDEVLRVLSAASQVSAGGESQETQLVRQSHIVAVRQAVLHGAEIADLRSPHECGSAHVQSSRLLNPIERSPDRAIPETREVDAVEHLVQQRRFATRPDGVEGFQQSVTEEVGGINVHSAQQLPAQRTNVFHINRQRLRDVPRQCQREVLRIRRQVILIPSVRSVMGIGVMGTMFDGTGTGFTRDVRSRYGRVAGSPTYVLV
jgi:hypothetical protein